MHTTSILYRRGRNGTSTILGTLIFVGIMFTAVIPMLLVMNQANTLYEIRKVEVRRMDEEHSREDISFYAYTLDDPEEISVKIENRGDALVKIVRVWINDVEHQPQEGNIQSMATMVLGPFPVVLESTTSYTVKVVTEKGNSFSSEAGTLYYSEGGWYIPSLGICVHIDNLKGKYLIVAKVGAEEFYHYESPYLEHGDVEEMIWVDGPGSYYLTIKKWDGGAWGLNVDPPYNDSVVEVEYPHTKPITDVYVSGIFP